MLVGAHPCLNPTSHHSALVPSAAYTGSCAAGLLQMWIGLSPKWLRHPRHLLGLASMKRKQSPSSSPSPSRHA